MVIFPTYLLHLGRLAACGFLCLMPALFSSCAHRFTSPRISADQGLRVSAADPCFVSATSTSKDQQGCGPLALQRMLGEDLRALGIPDAPASQARYSLVLECRDLPEAPRNQPPMAPGSRLWYQRRFYAPTFAKRSVARPADCVRQLELTVYLSRAASTPHQAPLFRASVVSREKSDESLEAAVRALAEAVTSRRSS